MKKISRTLLIVFIAIILLLAYSKIVYAIGEGNESNLILQDKSEAFKRWENLPDEERANAIEPSYSDISFKDSIKRSTYNAIATVALDRKYENRNNIVKDQFQTGCCWAFTFSSVIESTISKRYNMTREYSPEHIDYRTHQMYNRGLGDGGNAYLALAYSVDGYGPVYEEDFPFTKVYDEENNDEQQNYLKNPDEVNIDIEPKAIIENAVYFPNIYKSYKGSNITYEGRGDGEYYNESQVNSIRNLIKKHIKENGAVDTNIYSDIYMTKKGGYESEDGYYNPETKAYYCNDSEKSPNHDVTIVGWDDDFKKENFAEGNQPPKDGAYIVLNSWGDEFGENGYFYVSYDDVYIENPVIGISSIKDYDIDEKDYENIYQYDELGVSYSGLYFEQDSCYAANVFTKKDSQKQEYISKVGLYIRETVGVEVYINPADGDYTKLGSPVASYTGSNALEAGYHTIKLSSPVEITGNKFVVAVKYINKERVNVPLEANLKDSGLTKKETSFFNTAKSNKGESFISKDGINWDDLYNKTIEDTTFRNTNVCIKAITSVAEEEAPTPTTTPSPTVSPTPTTTPSPTVSPTPTTSPSSSPSERRNFSKSNRSKIK